MKTTEIQVVRAVPRMPYFSTEQRRVLAFVAEGNVQLKANCDLPPI